MGRKRKRGLDSSIVQTGSFTELPVYKERGKIIEAVNNHQVIVLVGETGSGIHSITRQNHTDSKNTIKRRK
jgi:HrpA-like RNA helicase